MNEEKKTHKVEKLVDEGDRYAAKGTYDKALKKYRKAHNLDPHKQGLYEKLIDAHEKSLGEKLWDKGDFAEHIDLIMHKQERDFPPIKQVHAKLSPEWQRVSTLIANIIDEDDDGAAGPLIEELVGHGDIATRALIDLLRAMRKSTTDANDIRGFEDDT